MKRLWRGDRYCAVREGNVASRLVEPGTPPRFSRGSVSTVELYRTNLCRLFNLPCCSSGKR